LSENDAINENSRGESKTIQKGANRGAGDREGKQDLEEQMEVDSPLCKTGSKIKRQNKWLKVRRVWSRRPVVVKDRTAARAKSGGGKRPPLISLECGRQTTNSGGETRSTREAISLLRKIRVIVGSVGNNIVAGWKWVCKFSRKKNFAGGGKARIVGNEMDCKVSV